MPKIIPQKSLPVKKKNLAPPKPVADAVKTAEAQTPQIVSYNHPNLKISPRKLRAILPPIKNLTPLEAIERLRFVNSNAARIMAVHIKNAINNAKANFNLNQDLLRFHSLRVDEGQKLKRMDKSHGSRFARGIIQKRHSRLVILLKSKIHGSKS